jgi:DNA-binding IclR family transcriptional regulator
MVRYASCVSEQTISDVGVLDKAMAIVEAVSRGPLSLAGLVDATGYHRATAHRLAVALEAHGLLQRDPTGRFMLGGRFVELGRVAGVGLPLADAARPILEQLVRTTGESAQLYIRSGENRVCIQAVDSPQGLRTIVPVGATLPLDRGSAGGVLLGNTPPKGWVQSVGEREAGVASVSAPIIGRDGIIRGAVSVSGPIERTTKSPGTRYGPAVIEAAQSIAQSAGLL